MSDRVKGNIESLCASLGDFVSTKTVVGDAITIGDVVLLPLIEVSFGMGAGGSEASNKGTAGGLGAIAIIWGHQRSNPEITWLCVFLIILIVQIIQEVGMRLAKKLDKRAK